MPATYFHKALNQDMGRAISRYRMISDGDRILVGVSGGKDSEVLLWLLKDRLGRVPISYELFAVYVDSGYGEGVSAPLSQWCRSLKIELIVEKTDFGKMAHGPENRENPCFLCSRLRRRRIFEIADALSCNKVAFGHHKDDIIETFFVNICYTGKMGTMLPKQSMFGGKLTIIRPLAFADENRIQRFANEMGFPVFKNHCPSAHASKRSEIKGFIQALCKENPKIKNNIFRSLSNVNTDYML